MRPIDADAVYPWYIKAFSKEEIGDRAINPRDLRFSMNDIKENLDNIPTLEQEPKIGHWIKDNLWTKPYCSECGKSCIGVHGFDCITTDFCPNCGAKMEV